MKHSITIIIALFFSLTCWAGVKNQSISINGTTAHKRVVEITYDDDSNVILKWSEFPLAEDSSAEKLLVKNALTRQT